MTVKEKMTAPVTSVGADVEQPLENLKTNQSIADLPGKGNLQATNKAENTAKSANKRNPDELETVSMMELYDTAYLPKLPIVDGLLYNGTYLFVGSPKIGKSFFMAQIGYHISKGLPLWGFSVRQRTVLYLALEDDYARLQKRLSQMFGMEGSENFYFATKSKSLNAGLEQQLVQFVTDHKDARLIIIDTLQKVREVGGDKFSYASDYEIVTKLKAFSDHYGICFTIAIEALELMIETVLVKKYKESLEQKEQLQKTDASDRESVMPETERTEVEIKEPVERQPEPKQPEMTRLASKYPRFYKIYNELEQQNNAIYKKEKQRSAKKKELSEIKGWFKGRKKKELQEEIDDLTSQIRNMKDYLPKIVQKVGYRSVQEFLKDFKTAKSEYSQYQKAIAQWKQETGKEPEPQSHGVRAKLAVSRKKIEQEQKNAQRTRSQSKDRGAR